MDTMKKTTLRNSNKNTQGQAEASQEARDPVQVVKDYFASSGRKIVRRGELEELGISQSSLRTLQNRKKILVRAGYGLYALSDWVRNEIAFEASRAGAAADQAAISAVPEANNSYLESFAEVSAQVPRAVISLLSASAYHNLTLDVPFQVWIALEHSTHPPKVEYPPIKPIMRRLRRYPGSLTVGVDRVEFDGVPILITDLERTIIDLYNYKGLPDPSMPRKALLEAMNRPEFDREKLLKYARQFGVREKIRPDIEIFDLMSTSRGNWADDHDDTLSMTL